MSHKPGFCFRITSKHNDLVVVIIIIIIIITSKTIKYGVNHYFNEFSLLTIYPYLKTVANVMNLLLNSNH